MRTHFERGIFPTSVDLCAGVSSCHPQLCAFPDAYCESKSLICGHHHLLDEAVKKKKKLGGAPRRQVGMLQVVANQSEHWIGSPQSTDGPVVCQIVKEAPKLLNHRAKRGMGIICCFPETRRRIWRPKRHRQPSQLACMV